MTPQEQLCEKTRVEQSAYCLWLTAQPPEEILHHAYEYSVREDIILATEEMNLTPARVRALLKSPAPLADVYKDFSKLETDYMSIVAQCVEDRADDLLKKEQQQNPPKVYRQSVTYAREHGELPQYHASCHLNERCRDEIDAALAQRFDGMRLGAGAVEQVVAEYGLERTKYVLAAAIQTRDGDGRISRTNREWADSIRTIKDMDRRGFDRSCYYADLQAHTCLLDGFVNQVRKFEKAIFCCARIFCCSVDTSSRQNSYGKTILKLWMNCWPTRKMQKSKSNSLPASAKFCIAKNVSRNVPRGKKKSNH